MTTATDGVLGPSTWGFTPAYRGIVTLDGFLVDPQEATSYLRPGVGSGIRLLGGGAFHQSVLAHQDAPEDLSPLNLSMTIRTATVASERTVDNARRRPVEMWIEQPHEEAWQLRTNDVRIFFSLSRPTAGLLVPSAVGEKYAPRARLVDFPKEDAETSVDLVVINSGSPATGEVLYDPTTQDTTIEVNADLVDAADGTRALVFLHWPLRIEKLQSLDIDQAPSSDVVAQLTFVELVPVVDYDAIEQAT